jgi:NAD(P)-dependent dehydrogenase (short-subunit alcohol dehydrogenase family)
MAQRKKNGVLITGAAKRIGKAIAIALAKDGYGIIAHYNSSRREICALGREIEELGVSFEAIKCDLSQSPSRLIKAVSGMSFKLCGLVNNASIFEKSNLLGDKKKVHRMLQINAFSPLELMRDFATVCKSGFIINMLDANIDMPNSSFQAYRISKRLLRDFTREMAFVLAPSIRVNGIAPGAVLPSRFSTPDSLKSSNHLLGNGGTIDDVIAAARYFVSSENITGQILYADGGMHLQKGVQL